MPWQLIVSPFFVAAGLLGTLAIPRAARWIGAAGLLAGLAYLTVHAIATPSELIRQDSIAVAWQVLFFAGGIILVLVLKVEGERAVTLTLGAVLGMQLMAIANHLFILFLGLELMSLSIYLLIYSVRKTAVTLEAAVKYFFSGGFAAALYLFGLSVYYAATGSMELPKESAMAPGAELAVALMGCAALFKLGAFPMNFWLPDAYEAASPELTGFMSTAVKAAGFLLLLRLIAIVALNPSPGLAEALPAASVLTMTIGNILALRQERLQRMLAYSSIAHAGYLLAAVWAWTVSGAPAGGISTVYFYLVIYLAMNTGAFLFLSAAGITEIKELRGFAAKSPKLAALFGLFILSLAGIPPLGGFLAKFFVIWDLIRVESIWLAIAIAVNSVFALGYYFKILREMVFAPETEGGRAGTSPKATGRSQESSSPTAVALMTGCAAATIALGLMPVMHRWITEWLSI